MPLQIIQLPLGAIQTNCYIVGDPDTKDAVIIDPSAQAEVILDKVNEYEFTVREILATHTHFDHILASHPVKEATGAPFRLHQDGLEQLRDVPQRMKMFGFDVPDEIAEPDNFIEHGDVVAVGEMQFEARFTPGHSPGHLIFIMREQNVAFVGDAIFRDGFGRTDLPGGDAALLKDSIVREILTLPDDMLLLTGHGAQTTVGREKMESAALAYLLNSV